MDQTMTSIVGRRGFLGLLGCTAIAGVGTLAQGRSPNRHFEVRYSAMDWQRRLGPARYRILREAGTERAFTSPLLNEKRKGIFACAGCDLPLFSSSAKYDSGTGWPSFWRALPNAVVSERDLTFGMVRMEELCRRCGGHLGHVFDDGPAPTGKRHCINGLSLTFKPQSRRA